MLVAMHVATAAALFIFYRSTWIRIIKGFFSSVGKRQIDSPDAKLAWLLLAATIPAGLVGTLFEHTLRTQFAKPLSAIIFLFINGCILLLGDSYLKHKEGDNYSLESTTRNVSSKLTLTSGRRHRRSPGGRAVRRHQPFRHHHGQRSLQRA